jgi:hypothetical protein
MTDRPHVEPPTESVEALGANLAALASSADHLGCLEVFANALKGEAPFPLLLNVLIEPLGGAQILTIGNPRPGLTLQVDADLEVNVTQLWFGEGLD